MQASTSSMKVAKTRKAHTKSRSGCFSCKSRHIRCDQRKPICFNCERYASECVYPQPKPVLAPQIDTPSLSPDIPSIEAICRDHTSHLDQIQAEGQEATLSISQLRLLHHFTTVTAKTLSADPLNEDVYSSYLVKVAFRYAFLLHAVLSLAALHLSHTEPRQEKEELLALAGRHHMDSISRFRTDIADVNQSNYEAVFLFSSTLFPYLWGSLIGTDASPDHTFDSIISNLFMTRRVRPLVHDFYETLSQSELGRLRPQDTRTIDWHFVVLPTKTELVELQKFADLAHDIFDGDVAEAYNQAIRVLIVVFDVAAQSLSAPSDALLKMWIHFVTPRFLHLLSEREFGALIIFAHYAVLVNRASQYWFLVGASTKILKTICPLIPTQWQSWIDWPRAQIKTADPVETCAYTL